LDVQELARTYTKEAVLTLVACLDDPRHKVSAAVALLDRGWGRPTQVVAGDEERPLAISFEWASASPQSQSDAPAIEGQPACEVEVERRPALELVWEQGES
jgi:hypothetical protein